jgi:hypothetical protein
VAKKERTVRTSVILPESLYATLKQIAEDEMRSTHKQIILALTQWSEEEQRRRRLSGRPLPTTEEPA